MTDSLAQEWWFCTPPSVEEVRMRVDRATGRAVGTWYSCPHGRWTSLEDARRAHGEIVDGGVVDATALDGRTS